MFRVYGRSITTFLYADISEKSVIDILTSFIHLITWDTAKEVTFWSWPFSQGTIQGRLGMTISSKRFKFYKSSSTRFLHALLAKKQANGEFLKKRAFFPLLFLIEYWNANFSIFLEFLTTIFENWKSWNFLNGINNTFRQFGKILNFISECSRGEIIET